MKSARLQDARPRVGVSCRRSSARRTGSERSPSSVSTGGPAASVNLLSTSGQTMRKTTSHSHEPISCHHAAQNELPAHPLPACAAAQVPGAEQQLDQAIEHLNQSLAQMSLDCTHGQADTQQQQLLLELTTQLRRVEQVCRTWEQSAGTDQDALRRKQQEFRRRTDPYFAHSYLMNRARTWPRGYPGDYEIIETAYNNQPVSAGIGHLLDQYFLSTTLAQGIRRRREQMRETLQRELLSRHNPRVLNIGCGPCREVLELADTILQSNAHFTNIDFDTDALLFSAQRLRAAGLDNHMAFRQYNAIRMVNAQKNVREFGQFDIIYTIGLLDYLTDEILVRLLRALFATLRSGGVLIAVFKDCDYYDTPDYHWLVDWSGFLQRTATHSRDLLSKAGIPDEAVTMQRTSDHVMIFYCVLKSVDTTTPPPLLQGPHDRRQEIDLDRELHPHRELHQPTSATLSRPVPEPDRVRRQP